MALESANVWRHTCSECTETLRGIRGCKKPGQKYELKGPPFRFDSPALQGAFINSDGKPDAVLYECPTGYILREAPYIYDVIDAANLLENCTPTERGRLSTYYHFASRLVAAERARHREAGLAKSGVKRDAAYGASVLRGRRR